MTASIALSHNSMHFTDPNGSDPRECLKGHQSIHSKDCQTRGWLLICDVSIATASHSPTDSLNEDRRHAFPDYVQHQFLMILSLGQQS